MFTSNQLNINTKKRVASVEKLSSGYRINRSADDAAGLCISEKMRMQIRGLASAAENVQNAVSYVQVANGALGEVTEIMQRMRVLAVQAANDTNTEKDRANIDTEVQQLKDGIDDIFGETEFNAIKIWDTNTNNKVQIGTEQKQAVTFNPSYQNFTITDANKGAVAYSGYKINVLGTDPLDTVNYGINISWSGYNGKDYSTSLISWDKLASSNGSFNISDYLDNTNDELKGISFQVSYDVIEGATVDDIAKALDGVNISSSPITSQSISNTKDDGNISLGVDITYLAELASGRFMDTYDTDFIRANISGSATSNVTTPDYNADPTDSSSLGFSFNMTNIGTVTGKCSSVYYYSNDTSDDKEGKWWNYVTYGDVKYKSTIDYTPAIPGTGLNSLLSCVNRNDGYSMTKDADSNGYIVLGFDLTSDSTYEYGGKSSNSVGSINVLINVSDNDTQEDLLNKIKSNFNENSIVDIFTGLESDNSPSNSYDYSYGGTANTSIIDVPIYKASHDVTIQAGANSNDTIHLLYNSLRTTDLGIADTNTLTREDSANAISKIDDAFAIVNDQRALFGAYENRLSCAGSNCLNTSENIQNSESRIRDLDMSDEIIELSKHKILEQTATSMLAQNNQINQGILLLLQ